jgi:glycosyltransferase involved in cell wall biosynthesis
VKIISDTTDLMPDGLEYIKMNRALKHMLISIGRSINNLIYSKVDAIVTINDPMGKILHERFNRDVHVIYGTVDLDRFKSIDKKDVLKLLPEEISNIVDGKFVVLYAGIMSPFQNPLVIVDVAEQIQRECRDIIFVAIGYGPLKQELKNVVSKKSLHNVIILDPVAHEVMPFIYNIADLTLLPPPVLSTSGMYEYFGLAMTRKFIEYAACGKPILCITPPCVASELCLKWKAGYHVLPQNVEEAVGIIKVLKERKELKELIGKNARRLAEDLFSIDYAARTLSKIVGTDTTDRLLDAPSRVIEGQKINVQ